MIGLRPRLDALVSSLLPSADEGLIRYEFDALRLSKPLGSRTGEHPHTSSAYGQQPASHSHRMEKVLRSHDRPVVERRALHNAGVQFRRPLLIQHRPTSRVKDLILF
jgi:hypothetical protein